MKPDARILGGETPLSRTAAGIAACGPGGGLPAPGGVSPHKTLVSGFTAYIPIYQIEEVLGAFQQAHPALNSGLSIIGDCLGGTCK